MPEELLRVATIASEAGLTPAQSTIFLLRYQDGWTNARIAEHLEIHAETVRSHLASARRRVRKYFAAWAEVHEQAEAWGEAVERLRGQ